MRGVIPAYESGLAAFFGLLDRTLGPQWVYGLYMMFAWTVVSFARNTAETVGYVYTTAVLCSGPACWLVCRGVAIFCWARDVALNRKRPLRVSWAGPLVGIFPTGRYFSTSIKARVGTGSLPRALKHILLRFQCFHSINFQHICYRKAL